MLEGDDPKGVKVYCDGQQPSFNPIDYNEDDLSLQLEAPPPPVIPPSKDSRGRNTKIPPTKVPDEVKCPTEAQELKEPIGTLVEGGTKKIIEYRLVGKECIAITEEITFVDQIVKGIPSANQVTTTAGIAIVATAAATATPILLRVVKPIIKQIFKRVQKLLGKEPPKLSANEIQTNKYREKERTTSFKTPKKKKK